MTFCADIYICELRDTPYLFQDLLSSYYLELLPAHEAHTSTARSVLIHQPAIKCNACSDGLCPDWWTTTSFCSCDGHTSSGSSSTRLAAAIPAPARGPSSEENKDNALIYYFWWRLPVRLPPQQASFLVRQRHQQR